MASKFDKSKLSSSPPVKSNKYEIVVRRWREDDLTNTKVLLDMFAESQGYSPHKCTIEKLKEDGFCNHPWYYALIAEVIYEGNLITIGIAVANLAYQLKRTLSVQVLYTIPEWRGQGVGTSLFNAMKKLALSLKCELVHWADEMNDSVFTELSKRTADFNVSTWLLYKMSEDDIKLLTS